MKRLLRIGAGILFCVFGFVGLFLPIIQGILFMTIGLILLAPDSTFIQQKIITPLKRRHPGFFKKLIESSACNKQSDLPQ